jgi:hypothetical protein
MSANRRRKLLVDHANVDSDEEDAELLLLRDECQAIFSLFGIFFDIIAVSHLFVAGCAIGYMIILTATDDFGEWARFFCRLSQSADYFFYVLTFFLFVGTASMTALLIQISSQISLVLVALGASALLEAISLTITIYCIPMSLMVHRSVDEFGEWYLSPLAENARPVLYGSYRSAIFVRLICVAIAGPVVSFFMSRIRAPTIATVFARM